MINIKKIKPMFNRLVVTAERYEDNVMAGNIIDGRKSNMIKEYQKVVATGSSVMNVKVGDIVMINPRRYAVKKHQEGSLKDGVIGDNTVIGFNFDTVDIDGVPHLLLYDNDIEYVIEDYEEVEEETSTIITPAKKEIIV